MELPSLYLEQRPQLRRVHWKPEELRFVPRGLPLKKFGSTRGLPWADSNEVSELTAPVQCLALVPAALDFVEKMQWHLRLAAVHFEAVSPRLRPVAAVLESLRME